MGMDWNELLDMGIIEKPDILHRIKGIGAVKFADIREFVDNARKEKEDQSQQQAAD